jgi:hypothetical protein
MDGGADGCVYACNAIRGASASMAIFAWIKFRITIFQKTTCFIVTAVKTSTADCKMRVDRGRR